MKANIRQKIATRQRNASATSTATTVTRCAICNLPAHHRVRIDRELIQETATLTQIANRIGCNKTSVMRHRDNHLLPAVKQELACIESGTGEVSGQEPIEIAAPALPAAYQRPDIRKDVRACVEDLYDESRAWADRAKDETAWPMAVAFIREARQSAELVARLKGDFDAGPAPGGKPVVLLLPRSAPSNFDETGPTERKSPI